MENKIICRAPANGILFISAMVIIFISALPVAYAFSFFDNSSNTSLWKAALAACSGLAGFIAVSLILNRFSRKIKADDDSIRISGGDTIFWSEKPVLISGTDTLIVRKGIPLSRVQNHAIFSPKGKHISWRTTSYPNTNPIDKKSAAVTQFAKNKTSSNQVTREFIFSGAYNPIPKSIWIISLICAINLAAAVKLALFDGALNYINHPLFTGVGGLFILFLFHLRRGKFIKTVYELRIKNNAGSEKAFPINAISMIEYHKNNDIKIKLMDGTPIILKKVYPEPSGILLHRSFQDR